MRIFHCLLIAVLAAAGLATRVAPARAGGSLEGKWLVQILEGGQQVPIWLIQLKDKDGQITGEVLDGRPGFDKVKFAKATAGKNSLHITLDFMKQPVELKAKKGQEDKALVGTIKLRDQRGLIQLVPTQADKVDPKDVKPDGKAGEDFKAAMKDVRSLAQAMAAWKTFVKDHPKGRVTLQVLRQLLQFGRNLDDKEVADLSAQAVEQAAAIAPELKMVVVREVVPSLLRSDKNAAMALEFAREAEKALPANASAADRQAVLKLVASALKKNKQADEASKVEAEAAKLNAKVDEEFEKTNIPFDIKPLEKRKMGEDRVVVVELFTGAECPPCVAADIAFDAAAKTFKAKDVILLEYHLHIPGADPMTNKDTITRSDQYTVEGTPTVFIDGKVLPGLGGGWQRSEQVYKMLRGAIADKLQEKAQAKVKLTATRKGDEVELVANVSGLSEEGQKARLYFVVFQDVVRYTGGNGQRLHHHVVRGLPGGAKGISLKGKSGEYKQTLSLKELQSSLADYVNDYIKGGTFPGGSAPLDLDHLHVAAILQDGSSAEILNAAQAAVPEK